MPYQELCGALADAEAYLYEHNDSLNSARERDKERVHVCVFFFVFFFFLVFFLEWGAVHRNGAGAIVSLC